MGSKIGDTTIKLARSCREEIKSQIINICAHKDPDQYFTNPWVLKLWVGNKRESTRIKFARSCKLVVNSQFVHFYVHKASNISSWPTPGCCNCDWETYEKLPYWHLHAPVKNVLNSRTSFFCLNAAVCILVAKPGPGRKNKHGSFVVPGCSVFVS